MSGSLAFAEGRTPTGYARFATGGIHDLAVDSGVAVNPTVETTCDDMDDTCLQEFSNVILVNKRHRDVFRIDSFIS